MATSNTPLPAGLKEVPTPAKIVAHLNKFIVGQDEAKRTLAVAVYNHYRRLQLTAKNPKRKWAYGKSNVLLLGPTGCGKTALVKCLANYLGVVCHIGDATTITQAGYVGDDVESLLVGLLRASNYDIEKAQCGIVFIDEVDKLASKGASANITRDVVGTGVQEALLKMMEGSVVTVPPQGGRKHPEQSLLYIDTSQILFICSGAFTGLDHIIRKRIGKGTGAIGFGTSSNKEQQDGSSIYDHILPEDLYKFGMTPEFCGRLPLVSYVNSLNREDLERIFVEPEDSLLRQYSELLMMDGIYLCFTKPAVKYMVDVAYEMGTGARALRSVAEKVLRDVMFDAPTYRKSDSDSDSEPVQYKVTEDMVRDKLKSMLEAV